MTDMSLHTQGCSCCADLLAKRFDRRRLLHAAAGAGLMAAFSPLAFAAEGKYEAMLLTCIDPRFPAPTIMYMEGRQMIGKYSQFTFAGASVGVVAPAFKTWQVVFWVFFAASFLLFCFSL